MPSNLKSRTSTINNAVVTTIIEYCSLYSKQDPIDVARLKKERDIIIKYDGIHCCYCRKNEAKTGDHFHPKIINGKPSMYGDDIANMIPCCSPCNSSKGGKLFLEWNKRLNDTCWIEYQKWHDKNAIVDERIMKVYMIHATRIQDIMKMIRIEHEEIEDTMRKIMVPHPRITLKNTVKLPAKIRLKPTDVAQQACQQSPCI